MRRIHRWFTLLILLSLNLTLIAQAQSGRKQKKTTPEPPPQGVKAPEARSGTTAASGSSSDSTSDQTAGHSDSDQPVKEDEKERTKRPAYYVGLANMDVFSNIPMSYTRFALDGCVRELRRGYSREVNESITMTRGEAIEAAKRSENVYVIFMELDARSYSQGGSGSLDLRFMLFEPKTGKVIASGFGYPRANAGRVPLPIGSSRLDVQLELMGRDVATQVLERVGRTPKK